MHLSTGFALGTAKVGRLTGLEGGVGADAAPLASAVRRLKAEDAKAKRLKNLAREEREARA